MGVLGRKNYAFLGGRSLQMSAADTFNAVCLFPLHSPSLFPSPLFNARNSAYFSHTRRSGFGYGVNLSTWPCVGGEGGGGASSREKSFVTT